MSALRLFPLAVGFALATFGCRGKPVTKEECDRLLDRYTEMLLRDGDPKIRSADLESARAEVRAKASTDRSFRACTRELSREQMDCALAAFGADAIERCLVPMP